jgi:hypothetical protein
LKTATRGGRDGRYYTVGGGRLGQPLLHDRYYTVGGGRLGQPLLHDRYYTAEEGGRDGRYYTAERLPRHRRVNLQIRKFRVSGIDNFA